MKKEFSKAVDSILKKKNKTLIVALLAAGVLLLAAGGLVKDKESDPMPYETPDDIYNAQYVQKLQADIVAFITQMGGVGRASVLVTLETGVQYEYATDDRRTDDTSRSSTDSYTSRQSAESNVIVVDGRALVLRRIEPTVQGVVIVCEGGGDPQVREKLIETVAVLCGIGTNRIAVSQMP